MSTAADDRLFMVARAMAVHDGHDPDQQVMQGHPLRIRGADCTWPGTHLFPVWHLYAGLAEAAINEIKKLGS